MTCQPHVLRILARTCSAGKHAFAVGRYAHRAERSSLVESVLGKSQASGDLDLLELTEYAWHDCHGEITPSDEVILNILICSQGVALRMIHAATVAIVDWGICNCGPSVSRRGRVTN